MNSQKTSGVDILQKMTDKKITTIKEYRKLFARKIKPDLWKKVQKLAKGTPKNKISAINTIFKEHYSLPEDCIKISITLANKSQPLDVRLQIARNLVKYPNTPFGMYSSLFEILSKSNDENINKILEKTSYFKTSQKFYRIISPLLKQISNFTKRIDWTQFKKAYHVSMLRDLNAVKDDRITAILSQVLAEYWLNLFIKNSFQNPKELSKLSFDNKRKILYGLQILKPTTNNDLKKLDDIRGEYAHNFIVDEKKVLQFLKQMDCYKQFKFGKNSKNNNRIKKCAISIILDLMDIEEHFIIEINKKKKRA